MIGAPNEAKVSHNEILKVNSPTLAGTLAQTLADTAIEKFSDDDGQFLKFHGIYQQDDRDKRKTGKQYIMMVRTRLPGGFFSSKQYIALDDLCREYGNNTLRITTRQGFQFHGIFKNGLGKLMKGVNDAMITTLAACGDVNRNVMAPCTPSVSVLVDRVLEDAKAVSDALLPKTKAYHEIWLDGKQLDIEDKDFVDPLYGKTYLPRKFKVAFAIPPENDMDIFTNCLGFVAIVEGNNLVGYNLLAGGGMGMSHNNAETYPRVADVIGFLEPQHVVAVAKAVLTIHRDFGDRTNRKHARLKYILAERGVEWFRGEVEQRAGIKLAPSRSFSFTRQGDVFGWRRQHNGSWFLGLLVEGGRVKDGETVRLKSALRKIAEQFAPEMRLSANQNLLLTNVPDAQVAGINQILAEHNVRVENQGSALRQASIVCPALPTCGLALAESERVFPEVITRMENLLKDIGLADEGIIMRMTGCPNGCARPYMAEIGFVGKGPNKYQVFVGGNEACTRLARVYKENVMYANLTEELRPLLTRYAQERKAGERLGDFCERTVLTEAPAVAAAAN